tara:strand:- start:497 stop:646 length:150 start_codon:yes stop_codon:yes gene_type:complete
MNGFTTTATISELIDKRPIKRKKRSNRSRKVSNKGSYRAVQRVLRVKGY